MALTREAHRERRSPGKKEYEEENYIITPEKRSKNNKKFTIFDVKFWFSNALK